MNSFFIGAKNVCIMFNHSKPIHIIPFINHCDKLFGWPLQYYTKGRSNKIYVIFSTLVRGHEFFNKIENNDIFIEFPSEVFVDNIPYIVRMRGFTRDNSEQLSSLLPNVENTHKVVPRVGDLENNKNMKKNEYQHLDEYISKKCDVFYSNIVIKYEDELNILKNKIKTIEDENKNLQFLIRQQTTVTTLMLEKTSKTENDLSTFKKQNEYTNMLLCENANNVFNIQTQIVNFQNWADNTKELLDIDAEKINSIKLSIEDMNRNTQIKNELFQSDISTLKDRKKWSEQIGQHQHQYALQKFNQFESRISKLEKNDKSNVSKEIKLENIPTELTLAERIDSITTSNTSQDLNLNQVNTNSNENDDYYGEDDENMFIIIKE
jgi:hypothetical protein